MHEAFVLGVAQDGGVPHMGCACRNCAWALSSPEREQLAVSIAIVRYGEAYATPEAWLVDCGPDIKRQWRMLNTKYPGVRIQGVFLTHLHMGHYIGLFQFGKEVRPFVP